MTSAYPLLESINDLKAQLTKEQISFIKPTQTEKAFIKKSTFFNSYNIKYIQALGKGGFGTVFGVPKQNERVAIKVLKFKNTVSLDKEYLWAQHCELLKHPNVININNVWVEYPNDSMFTKLMKHTNLNTKTDGRIPFSLNPSDMTSYDLDDDETCLYPIPLGIKELDDAKFYRFYEMEYCDKGTFAEFVDKMKEKADVKLSIQCIRDVCSGLGYLYTLHIYPKDVLGNPKNILLKTDPQTGQTVFKLTDFGLVKYSLKNDEEKSKWEEEERCWVLQYLVPLTHTLSENDKFNIIDGKTLEAEDHFHSTKCLEELEAKLRFELTDLPQASLNVYRKFIAHFRKRFSYSTTVEQQQDKDNVCLLKNMAYEEKVLPEQNEKAILKAACIKGDISLIKKHLESLDNEHFALLFLNHPHLTDSIEIGDKFEKQKKILNIVTKQKEELIDETDWDVAKWKVIRNVGRSEFNYQLLQTAIKTKRTDTVELLVESRMTLIDPKDTLMQTKLAQTALETHDEAIIKLALKHSLIAGLEEATFQLLKQMNEKELIFKGGRTAFFLATWNGHLTIAKRLLNELKCDVNKPNVNDATPFMAAVYEGHFKMVKWLMGVESCDVTKCDLFDCSPLYIAAVNGHLKILELFLGDKRFQCLIDKASEDGVTPFCAATSIGHVNIVERLSENCDINKADKHKRTPLYKAAASGNLKIVKLLVNDQKCDINAATNDNATPFHLAAQNGHRAIIEFLMNDSRCDIHKATSDKCTPFYAAARQGHVKIIKILLKLNDPLCDVNTANIFEYTPLLIATLNGHKEVVELLMKDSRCNVNKPNLENVTPFYAATMQNHEDIMRLFLDDNRTKKDLNTPTKWNETPLWNAAFDGHANMVELFLSFPECDVNKGKLDLTPLFVAVQEGHVEIVKMLLNHSQSNVNKAANDGTTPFSKAVQKNHIDIVKLFMANSKCDITKATNDNTTPLHFASAFGHAEVLRLLLNDSRYNEELINKIINGLTPFHAAAFYGQRSTVEVLMGDARCQLNKTNDWKESAFFYAVVGGHLEVAKLMSSDSRCYINQQNEDGNAPLHMAVKSKNYDLTQFLSQHQRCNVNIVNKNEETPLSIAIEKSTSSQAYKDLAMLLLKNENCTALGISVDQAIAFYSLFQSDKISQRITMKKFENPIFNTKVLKVAIKEQDTEKIEELVNNNMVIAANEDLREALLQVKNPQMLNLLLKMHITVKVNEPFAYELNNTLVCLLDMFIANNQGDWVKHLLAENTFDINVRINDMEETLLFIATREGNTGWCAKE